MTVLIGPLTLTLAYVLWKLEFYSSIEVNESKKLFPPTDAHVILALLESSVTWIMEKHFVQIITNMYKKSERIFS